MIEELYINDLSKMGIIGEVLSVKKEYYDLEGGDEQFDFSWKKQLSMILTVMET